MVSKLNPEDAAIHLFGFNLTENEQGKKVSDITVTKQIYIRYTR